jgi:AraC-like DNA-binding protein
MKRSETLDQASKLNQQLPAPMAASMTAVARVNAFRIHMIDVKHTVTGSWWGTEGKPKGEVLHHIEIPLSGHRQVVHGKNVLDLTAGHVYFLPGNTPIAGRHIESSKTIWIRFRCEWLPGVDPLMDWHERSPCILASADPSYWKQWLRLGWGTGANHVLELHSRIEHWLAEGIPDLDAIIDRHLTTHSRFEAVFQVLEDRLGADLRIADLAKAYGTEPYAFTRAFSAATRSTPKAYLNRRINQAAIQLLTGSDLTIKQIAYRLRFSDEFYFSRFFKKLNGRPPSACRRSPQNC